MSNLQPFLLRIGDLVLQIPFGSHVVFKFSLFLRRKGSNFGRFEQETEEFTLKALRPIGKVFHVVEGIADLLEDGRFGRQDTAVGEFQEDELEPVGHAFEGLPFTQVVPEEDPVRVLVDGEIEDADEIHGGKIVRALPGRHLFLNGEGRIEKRPLPSNGELQE